MKREINNGHPAVLESIKVARCGDVKAWLQKQADSYRLKWLLAHADDGVIWGRVDNGKLVTSDKAVPEVSPDLRKETLHQARLFASHAEILLWRDGENCLYARLIRDAKEGELPYWQEAIDESHILWGTNSSLCPLSFTLVSDGHQGFRHAVPFEIKEALKQSERPLRLEVRHYIGEDEDGFAQIAASRLMNVREVLR